MCNGIVLFKGERLIPHFEEDMHVFMVLVTKESTWLQLILALIADPAPFVSQSVQPRLTWFHFQGKPTLLAHSLKYGSEHWDWKLGAKQFRSIFSSGIFSILPSKLANFDLLCNFTTKISPKMKNRPRWRDTEFYSVCLTNSEFLH